VSRFFVEHFPDSLPFGELDYRFMLTRIGHFLVSDLANINRVRQQVIQGTTTEPESAVTHPPLRNRSLRDNRPAVQLISDPAEGFELKIRLEY